LLIFIDNFVLEILLDIGGTMTPAEIASIFDWYSADLPQNCNFSAGNPQLE
jgi:hypothetical protein